MSKIFELADAYAHAVWGESDEQHEARAALQAEVEKLEAENAKLREALELCYEHCRLYHPEVEKNNVGLAARAALGETK